MPSTVIGLSQAECRAGGDVVARAFADDAVFTAIFPDRCRRHRLLPSACRGGLVAGLLSGKAVDATPTLSAVSMWTPPGHRESVAAWIRALPALGGFLANLTPSDAHRFLRWTSEWQRRRRQLLPEPHWYLDMLCTDPRWKGYGLGAVLAIHGLERAAADGKPTFLETENEENVRFYSKLGFEVIEAGDDSALHIPIWRMVCAPGQARVPVHGRAPEQARPSTP